MLYEPLAIDSDDSGEMQKTKVLIVDDEHAIRRFLHTSLDAHGYEVHEAATGEDALLKRSTYGQTSSSSIWACRASMVLKSRDASGNGRRRQL